MFAFTVRYLHNTHQDIDFTEWNNQFLEQQKEYMDQIEDVSHDLTKVDIPVMGADVIDGPKFFELVENTLGTTHLPCGAYYTYVTRPCFLSIYEGEELFNDFEHFEVGKENTFFSLA